MQLHKSPILQTAGSMKCNVWVMSFACGMLECKAIKPYQGHTHTRNPSLIQYLHDSLSKTFPRNWYIRAVAFVARLNNTVIFRTWTIQLIYSKCSAKNDIARADFLNRLNRDAWEIIGCLATLIIPLRLHQNLNLWDFNVVLFKWKMTFYDEDLLFLNIYLHYWIV